MRLKLTLVRSGQTKVGEDMLVTVDTTVSVGELARTIARCDPRPGLGPAPSGGVTFRIDGDGSRSAGRFVPCESTVADAGLRPGQIVSIVEGGAGFADSAPADEAAAVLSVIEGPDKGARFPLRAGMNRVGRGPGNDVALTDSMVSKGHARINVGDFIEIVDLGSSNGVIIGDEAVPRAVLRSDDLALLGDSVVKVEHLRADVQAATSPTVAFNRSPWLDSVYAGEEFEAPEPPKPPHRARFPLLALLAPVALGVGLYAMTHNAATLVFIAFSPVMMIGNYLEGRLGGRKEYATAVVAFHQALGELADQILEASVREAAKRREEHPATSQIRTAATTRLPLMWTRRPDRRGFLELRLGLGRMASRSEVKLPTRSGSPPDIWAELAQLQATFRFVDDVPLVGALGECGSVGIAGPRSGALACVRALVVQLAGLHSPAEVVLCAVAPSSAIPDWDWVKWLPHVGSDHSPLGIEHTAATPRAALRLIAALEELVERRTAEKAEVEHLPAVVVLVDDDAPVERSRLVELAELGPVVGVHLIWVAALVSGLPAACRTFVEIDPIDSSLGAVGFTETGLKVNGVRLETLEAKLTESVARSMAPVVDAGARLEDDSDLPRTVSMVSLLGPESASSPGHVLERWRMSNSLPSGRDQGNGAKRRRKDNHLRASIGVANGQGFVLDLREHGPHALVGGTTGSGKSEFLQSWVLGLAVEHSPTRVNFLFVDYKGGSAFGECIQLPHSVGLVTDLSPYLVRRVLTSLGAEIRHRERLLNTKKAKDLLQLERSDDPDTPPALVIVVDEFAALASDVPEFVDGVVDVAQRGRSLGLHLVLATQRPAGVIKDNLRANTNLRIALRMADEDDSSDVIGTTQAALFDPALPGRAVAKVGPGRLTSFQSGYVGGWTADRPPRPVIKIEELRFGPGDVWEDPAPADPSESHHGPNDLQRLVSTVVGANAEAGLPAPRRPWLDVLDAHYELARSRSDSELIFGFQDEPENQRQVQVSFLPDRDGNMAVYGTGGSGKSGFLRTLGIVAGLSKESGLCHVYGLDFGTRGLQMLEELPHVAAIINGDDHERIVRVLRFFREQIDERSVRFAKVNAGSIIDYRRISGQPEPRLILLVDGIGAFRQAYEAGDRNRWFDTFHSIAADGRQVGAHVVVSADRAAVVPPGLGSVIQRRLVLRLAGENEYSMLEVPADALNPASPPGRGFMDGKEVQVATLGRTPNTVRQAAAIRQLSASLRERAAVANPPVVWPKPIERLRDRVRLGDLPISVQGCPVLGLSDETLGPIPFVAEGTLLVAGPTQSGKTTVLGTVALSLHRLNQDSKLICFSPSPSPLHALLPWADVAVGVDEIEREAKNLTAQLEASGSSVAPGTTLLVESLPEFLNTSAESPLEDLFRACKRAGVFVVIDAEMRAMSSSWSLLQPFKAARHGIALQPDQLDGDTVFTTPFPRISRAEFPAGRGIYLRSGKLTRVQCALPEVDGFGGASARRP